MQQQFNRLPIQNHKLAHTTALSPVCVQSSRSAAHTAGSGTISTAALAAACATTNLHAPHAVAHNVSTWLSLQARLHEPRSALGLVGSIVYGSSSAVLMPAQGIYSRTVLHNCMGEWRGGVPVRTPALLCHTGYAAMATGGCCWMRAGVPYLNSIQVLNTGLGCNRPELRASYHS
jgi:hypothetical protein